MQFNSARLRVSGTVLALTISALAGVRAATPDVLGFLFKIGPATVAWGYGDSEFAFPTGLALGGPDNRIYVSDLYTDDRESYRVRVFESDGTFAFSFGGPGTANGQFRLPMGVAVDDAGQILVADTWNHRLQLFGPTGTWLLRIGLTEGNFDPIDPVNLDEVGTYIGPTPTPGVVQFSYPTRVALRPHTRLNDSTDSQGRIAVLDQGNHRVVVLSSTFVPLFTFGAFGRDGNAIGEFEYPFGVGIDDAGNFYVADPNNHRIQIFDASGKPKRVFGSQGASNLPGDLQTPYDAQPDGRGGIIVSDSDNSRILILAEDPATNLVPRCSDVPASTAAGRCAIVASDGTKYDARVLGEAGGLNGQFIWPAAAAADALGRVAVLDTENHRLQMFKPARLAIASTAVTPAGTVTSGQSVTLNLTVQNTGGIALSNVNATVTPSLGGVLTALSPAAGIAVGGAASFGFTFVTNENGSLTFAIGAAGQTATGASVAAPPVTTSPAVTVTAASGAKLFPTISATPSPVERDGVITVQMTLKNTGNVSLSNVTPSVNVSPASLVTLLTQPAPNTSPLAPNAARSYTFTYKASATELGDVVFKPAATATYKDPAQPKTPASYTLAAGASPAATVKIVSDGQPPVTQIAVSGTSGTNGWYRSSLHVVLTATDPGAGTAAFINFAVVGLMGQSGRVPGSVAEFDIEFEGGAHVTFWAEDAAGNFEAKQTRHYKLDTIAPVISKAGVVPAPNAAGWNNQSPTVSFKALDAGSGIASLTPPQLVSTDGAGQAIPGTAVDFAGNTAETTIVVNVDRIKPVPVCTAARQPNAAGWYNANITINCTAADQSHLSGMTSLRASCAAGNESLTTTQLADGSMAASCIYSTDGVFTFLAEAADLAGNLATTTFVVRVDKIAPGLTCTTVDAGEIWPPNHKMIPWTVKVDASDATSAFAPLQPVFKLASFTSSEAIDLRGSGKPINFDQDMDGWVVGTPDLSGFVRSERSGTGTGRLYQLMYTATDLAGNVTPCVIVMRSVPHDQGKK